MPRGPNVYVILDKLNQIKSVYSVKHECATDLKEYLKRGEYCYVSRFPDGVKDSSPTYMAEEEVYNDRRT